MKSLSAKGMSDCSMVTNPDFMENQAETGDHNGHKIRGEVKPAEKLGIHGTNVALYQDVCNGDGICISVCPISVFDWIETPGHPASERKSDPINETQCILPSLRSAAPKSSDKDNETTIWGYFGNSLYHYSTTRLLIVQHQNS